MLHPALTALCYNALLQFRSGIRLCRTLFYPDSTGVKEQLIAVFQGGTGFSVTTCNVWCVVPRLIIEIFLISSFSSVDMNNKNGISTEFESLKGFINNIIFRGFGQLILCIDQSSQVQEQHAVIVTCQCNALGGVACTFVTVSAYKYPVTKTTIADSISRTLSRAAAPVT